MKPSTSRDYRNWLIIASFLYLSFIIASGFLDVFFDLSSGLEVRLENRFKKPSWEHWLGCDGLGRDVFVLMSLGAKISLQISFLAVLLSTFLGIVVGLISGATGGWIDQMVMRLTEVFLCVPTVLVAMIAASLLGPGSMNLIFAIAITGWTPVTRLVRAQILSLKHRECILACEVLGIGRVSTLFRHMLPLVLTPIIVQSTFALAGVILVESSLSFLGLGVDSNTPTWGRLLSEGKSYLVSAPHLSTIPGVAIMGFILSINFLGDFLREKLESA